MDSPADRSAAALERIADALEHLAKVAPSASSGGMTCEACGSPLETFTAQSGKRYRRCLRNQQLYKQGKKEEGHHFSEVG